VSAEIPDERILKALDWAESTAAEAAQDEANLAYLEGYKSHLLARLMKASNAPSVAAQRIDAEASQEYLDHIKGQSAAQEKVSLAKRRMIVFQTLISTWQSMNANKRSRERL
jgi:uncharacterized protein (DUF1501 family)